METIVCYFDGSCEPRNPGGTMGVGAVIFVDNKKEFTCSIQVDASPKNSNNVAEYLAFENVIDWLFTNGYSAQPVTIKGDSKLVVMQMSMIWKIKPPLPGDKPKLYYDHAIRCRDKVLSYFDLSLLKVKWIGRDENALADQLSKSHLAENSKLPRHADTY